MAAKLGSLKQNCFIALMGSVDQGFRPGAMEIAFLGSMTSGPQMGRLQAWLLGYLEGLFTVMPGALKIEVPTQRSPTTWWPGVHGFLTWRLRAPSMSISTNCLL